MDKPELEEIDHSVVKILRETGGSATFAALSNLLPVSNSLKAVKKSAERLSEYGYVTMSDRVGTHATLVSLTPAALHMAPEQPPLPSDVAVAYEPVYTIADGRKFLSRDQAIASSAEFHLNKLVDETVAFNDSRKVVKSFLAGNAKRVHDLLGRILQFTDPSKSN